MWFSTKIIFCLCKNNKNKQLNRRNPFMLVLNGVRLQTEQFPNNETKVKDIEHAIKPSVSPSLFATNILEFKYESDSDFMPLMFVRQRLKELRARCYLFVWYMPYSRMDRKIPGDLFTLQYVCEFINWLNFEKVIVMEPHSKETMERLNHSIPVYPVVDWLPRIQAEIGFSENDHVVYPDKGAAARYGDNDYYDICIMEKKRNPLTGNIEDMRLKKGKVNLGSKCIIIDDLCSKGGTFAWAGSILKSLGASEVYLVVSHCEETIFQGKLLDEDSPISRVYTSTSMMCKKHPRIQYMDVNVKNYSLYGHGGNTY